MTAPVALQKAPDLEKPISKSVKLHVAGPRFFLPPSEIHSVFPPENGGGDYNNILPHVVLNRRTLPWERLVDQKIGNQAQDQALEQIPFLALLVFSEDEEIRGDVTPPEAVSLADLLSNNSLRHSLEPGEKPTDKVNVIDVKRSLLQHIIPTGEELRLLTHGREQQQGETYHQRAVVIANRLPAPPDNGSGQRRNIAHLVMLENRYTHKGDNQWTFSEAENTGSISVRLVCLKSWQFNCTTDKPTLRGRLLSDKFTFAPFCVPKHNSNNNNFESIRQLSYTALPYHLRWGDQTHTLYHGPLVASVSSRETLDQQYVPTSSDSLMRILENHRIFDVSLAAAWQLGRLLMLRDQSIAMESFCARS